MPQDTQEKVARYCPECGKKFTAAESQFADPRICPSCKTRVLFLDYPKENPPEITQADEDVSKRDPKVQLTVVILIFSAVVALLLFCLIALVTGRLNVFFVLSVVGLIAGIVGVSIYLDSVAKAAALDSAYRDVRQRLQFHEANQFRLVNQLRGLQRNFDSLAEDERTGIRQQHESLLTAAEEDRDQAARDRENAEGLKIQYGTAAQKMCDRLLTEVRKSIKSRLTPNNFATQKDRFMKTVAFCEKSGYPVPQASIEDFLKELRADYEEAVRMQTAKEEQARIKEKIREEQRAERELEREMKRIAAEQNAIEKALEAALARTHDEHSAEVDELRRRLSEAEANAERAKSMAQLTKAGNVYVISNLGSFGQDVFKIGMTRRLEPMDRVKELGDASVPFPFDVHMMISSDNAPALESALHREFHSRRLNRVNLRKEFFRVEIDEIAEVVERTQGRVEYVADPEALEFNESQRLTDEDFAFISSQVDAELLSED